MTDRCGWNYNENVIIFSKALYLANANATYIFHLCLHNMVEVRCKSAGKTQDVAVFPLSFAEHLIKKMLMVMMTMMMTMMTSIWLSSSLSTVRDVFPSFSYKLCRPHLYVEIVQFLKKIVMILMGLWLCVLCIRVPRREIMITWYILLLLYTKNSSKWLLWWHSLDVCQLVTVPSSRAWSSQRYRGRCYNWILYCIILCH